MHISSMIGAAVLLLAPAFAPPPSGWVAMPVDPNHPKIVRWELPSQGQQFTLSVTTYSGSTEQQRGDFERIFRSGQIPLEIVSQGTLKLCRGLVADTITVVSTRGLATYNEHVFVAYGGKLYDLTYTHVNEKPLAEAEA